jgi:hypothetical protein
MTRIVNKALEALQTSVTGPTLFDALSAGKEAPDASA